jgi:integrase
MRTTLTENAVRAAQPGSTLWDGSLKHFGLRVAPGGTKSFLVLLGSGRRQAIGRYPEITLAQARVKAKRILAERTLGRHQSASISWQTAVPKFIEARRANTRPDTVEEYERTLKRYLAFGTTRLSDITKRDISAKLEKLNRVPSQKAHALVICKMFFRWALMEGFIEVDPAAAFKRSKQRKRARVLSDAELQCIWRACDGRQSGEMAADTLPRHFCTIVQLLILMGQRRGETAALRGGYYSHNQQTICLPSELTKSGREHTFPISEIATSILQSLRSSTQQEKTTLLFPARGKPDRPFNGWSKSKAALDELSGVKNWTLHDLRRTFRTIHGRIGTPPHIAERLINHVNAVASDVEQTYDIWTYMPEMRKATHAYEVELNRIFSQQMGERRAA